MDIQKLNQAQAEILMYNYDIEVSQKLADPSQDIDDWFTWGADNEKNLLGFRAPLVNFGVFNNLVGTTKFSFSFGLKDRTSSTHNSPRFTILIKTMNDNNTIQSDYYQLMKPYCAEDLDLQYPPSDSVNMSVPQLLYDTWTSAWADFTPKTAGLCSIDINNSPTVLKKYLFKSSDAIDTLYPTGGNTTGANQNGDTNIDMLLGSTVFICMANHCTTSGTVSNVGGKRIYPFNFDTSRIGLFLGVATNSQENPKTYSFISSCYDFSAPCPPTCPMN